MAAADEDRVRALLEECKGHDYVRFTMCDMNGIPKTRAIPARHLKEMVEEGPTMPECVLFVGPTSISYPGMSCSFDNRAMSPIPGSFYTLPWVTKGKYKVGEFLCDLHELGTGLPIQTCSRIVAMKQIARLAERRLQIKSAFEMEFILLDKETQTKAVAKRRSFSTSTGHAALEDFIYNLADLLHQAGIDIEALQEELGSGQVELNIGPSMGISASDQVFKFKQATREIALKHDMFVTFMSVPFIDPLTSNGLHFNHSILTSDGTNAFYDKNQPEGLSEFARFWIAGIMKHCKALAALCAPTVNCYRRYHHLYAPDKVNWGLEDRNSSLRVKNNGPKGTYMENRLGSGAANPYIVMAATIAAGLDGVEKKMVCPSAATSDKCDERLPDSLQEALEFLKRDDVLRSALEEDFITLFVQEKELAEITAFSNWKTDDISEETKAKERDMYLEHM